MSGLLGFYLWNQLKLAFSPSKRMQTLLRLSGWVLVGGCYGYLFGWIAAEQNVPLNGLLYGIHLFVFLCMILSIWFPQLSEPEQAIAPAFPVSKPNRSLFHWVISLFRTSSVGVLLLYIIMFVTISEYHVTLWFSTVIILLAMWTIRYSVMNIMVHRYDNWVRVTTGILLLALGVFIIGMPLLYDWFARLATSISILPALSGYYVLEMQSRSSCRQRRTKSSGKILSNFPEIQLIIRNRKARNLLLAGLLFKIVFLVAFTINPEAFTSSFGLKVIFLLYLMPILTFSYVCNNVWGFFPELWVSIVKVSSSVSFIFKKYLRVVFYPVLIETLIAIPSLFLVLDDIITSLFIVLVGGLTLVITGFVTSVLRPKVTGSAFRFGGNTHQMAFFAHMLILSPLLLLTLHPLIWALMPLYPIGYWLLYRYVQQTYEGHRRNIYQSLIS